jgi:hypothetical protein
VCAKLVWDSGNGPSFFLDVMEAKSFLPSLMWASRVEEALASAFL